MKLRITLITLCMDDPEKDVREAAVKTRIIPGPHEKHHECRSPGEDMIVWTSCWRR
jgi:hypothetical protein